MSSNSEIYKGDVLEHTLNFGVESAKKRFNLSEKEVKDILFKFGKEVDPKEECSCERANKNGESVMMCFMCDNPSHGKRIPTE